MLGFVTVQGIKENFLINFKVIIRYVQLFYTIRDLILNNQNLLYE
jgi:hypothetical protein